MSKVDCMELWQKEAPLSDRSGKRDSFSVNIPFIAVSRR